MLCAFSSYGNGTNMEGEVLALKDGITLCRNKGFTSVQGQTDSKIAVDFLKHQAQFPWRLEYSLRECSSLLGHYGIEHIYREGNRVADSLANEAHRHKSHLFFAKMEELPVSVASIISQDVQGFYSYRN